MIPVNGIWMHEIFLALIDNIMLISLIEYPLNKSQEGNYGGKWHSLSQQASKWVSELIHDRLSQASSRLQQDNNMRSTRQEIFLKEIEVRKNHTKMCSNYECVSCYWILITPLQLATFDLHKINLSLLIWQGGFYHSKHAVEFAKITEPLIIRPCAPLLTNNWLLFQSSEL